MDTPDKKTHPSPSFLSKFEDSPVFNYISTLSPIKPFSVGHNTQPFHLFNFSSPQALQTPPTSYPKEPKIPSTDVINNNCSKNEGEGKNAASSVPTAANDLHSEEVDKINREVSVRASGESSKLASEFPRTFKYDCDAPRNNMVHSDAMKPRRGFNMAGTELFPVKAIQNNSKEENCSFENEMGVQAIQMEHSTGSDALNCRSPTKENCRSPTKENCHDELDNKNGDSRMLSFVSTVLQSPNEHIIDPQTACPVKSEKCDMEVPLNTPGEIRSSNESIQLPAGNPHAVHSEEVHYSRTEVDDKSCSQQQQATRRRCLVYEMSGSHYRKLLADSTGKSPSKLAASSNTSNDKNVMASRPVGNRFSSTLPSIGLHLNALAAASKDKIIVKRQTLTCRRQLINSPCITPLDSLVSDTKPITSQTTPEVVERELVKQKDGVPDGQKEGVQVSGNLSDNSFYGEGIEFTPSSPKKKRRNSENVGEPDSCKRCNCKRSKCLKLYCECFAAGLYCVEPCNCQDCYNKPIHEETVLETRRQIESRNPLAFAPKVIRCSGTPNSAEEVAKTPASARHKRGCNCKKSGCLKKYCECFQGGVGCSLSCRCEGCKNTFGRKEGTESMIFQEPQFLQMNATDGISHEDEENCDQVAPNPSKNARQPVRRPFHFDGMTPHLPAHPSESYIQSCTSQKINESDQTAFEEDMKPEIEEVDAPESLKGDYSIPNTCVKSTSPNCKRISSPHYYFGTSPGWRSCRKVILRSVPCSNPEKESNSMELPRKL